MGVHMSPGRSDSVAEVTAAPPESAMTFVIFSSVISMECLWLAGSAARGATFVNEMTATSTSSAMKVVFFRSISYLLT